MSISRHEQELQTLSYDLAHQPDRSFSVSEAQLLFEEFALRWSVDEQPSRIGQLVVASKLSLVELEDIPALELDQLSIPHYSFGISKIDQRLTMVGTKALGTAAVQAIVDTELKIMTLPSLSSQQEGTNRSVQKPLALNGQQGRVAQNLFKPLNQIAYDLGISVSTVRSHLTHIRQANSISTNVELTDQLLREGILSIDQGDFFDAKTLFPDQVELLKHNLEYTHQQIAEMINMPASLIKSRLHRTYNSIGTSNPFVVYAVLKRDGLL